uniref:M16 family metallopeptidase n=1 Tax=Altererythrobacter segetis TaxID=1104773 RepID=UPI001407A702|nr:M16 family metallopeptidase [Altererythrobacter segetis]
MLFRRWVPALLLAFALPLSPLPAKGDAPAAAATSVWPFAKSDLPLDPSYRFGLLPNGMRYVVRANATPAAQGMVQMWVHQGSLAERDDEAGWAHFIEHMAFNGSAHVPEGEMVKLLEREGLAFGADTNAQTGFDATVYKLDLPRNDPKLLDTALMLMRETASELTFAPEAVEREKGVVLSEKRVRDTFAYRDTVDQLNFAYPGSKFAARLPIGTAESVQGADAARLKALWQRLYRPQDVAVIVVGDFDAAKVEAAIKAHFADWEAPAAQPQPDPGPLDFEIAGKTDIYLDPALPERITVSRTAAYQDEPDTLANRQQQLLRQIGYGIVNRRLQRLARDGDPPFRGAGLGTSDVFKTGRTTSLVVDAGEGEWQRALAAAEREYRRALEFGFTPAEIAEQVANQRTAQENAAAGAATRNNATFVGMALSLLQDERIPTTPESSLERFNAFAPQITPEAVLAALEHELVPLDNPLIRFEGRTAPKGGAEALRAAWNAGMAEPLVRQGDAALAAFAYTDFGPPGKVVSDKPEPLLGIREIVFANGLKLNLKPTQLQKDRVSLSLAIDGGQMLDTRDQPLATAMVSVLPVGGLGKHSYDELQSILAGRSVNFAIGDGERAFRMGASTTPRDLELQLELLAAAISDPGYRPQGEAQYRRNIENYFASLNATPDSALGNNLGRIVSDGDPRFTLQPKDAYLALSFAKLKGAIGDRLAHGALELAIVGDFDSDKTIALVARTLGALPPRESEFRDYEANRTRPFTADRSLRVIRHSGPADQAIVRMSWPTEDDSNFDDSLRLELLQRVVQVELTDDLREKLGATYSPGVNASQSRTWRGYGTFNVAAPVAASQVEPARQAMLDTIARLAAEPVDADTLLRARQPLLEAYDNALKTNAGWLSLADDAQREPDQIARFVAAKAKLAAITPEELQAIAAKYLKPAERLEIDVLPKED